MSRVLKAGADTIDLAAAAQREDEQRVVKQQLTEAYEAGHAQGLADGRARADAEGGQAGIRAAAALERLAAGAAQDTDQQVQDQRDELLRSALEIAEWVLRKELSDNGYAMLQRLEVAMSSLLPDRHTEVSVAPGDAQVVSGWAKGMRVEVIVDPALLPGDARIRTSHGEADVSIAAALQLASDVLGVTREVAA